MKMYDRHTGKYMETGQYGQGALAFLYGNPFGRMLLKIAVSPLTSRMYGLYNSLPVSAKKIPGFIEKYGVAMSGYEKTEYRSFNDFFTRKRRDEALHIDADENALIAPADSKLLVYSVTDHLKLTVKGSVYHLNELVDNRVDLSDYSGGLCLVFRLCMDDYHRYCFVDSGNVAESHYVKGKLHTVSSISKDYKIYKENAREVTICDTDHFGRIIQIEVGALLVGRIVNHRTDTFSKGEEKGYFEPGGSTIILLLKKNAAVIDEDILIQSAHGTETIVKYGEKIGEKV